jgi:hypothetical protein
MLFIMSELEQRRRKLLQETRKTYAENSNPPAIHPRYRAMYRSIYPEFEEKDEHKSNDWIVRLFCSVVLFVVIYMYRNESVFETILNLLRK